MKQHKYNNTSMKRTMPIVFALLFFMFAGLCLLWPQDSVRSKQYTIYMILWRGMTDAEKGFKDYFTNKNINVNFIIKDCSGDKSKLVSIVEDIQKVKPDLIYTFGTTVTSCITGTLDQAPCLQFIKNIPVVFNIVADPVGARLVSRLDSSGRNITGVSHMVPLDAQVKAMKSVVLLKRLAVIFNPEEENSRLMVKELENSAEKLGYTLIKAPVIPVRKTTNEIEYFQHIIDETADQKPDLIYIPSDSYIISNAKTLLNCINNKKIPTFSATEVPLYEAGAFMGLVSRYYTMGQFAGYKAEQVLIFKKDIASMPVETLKRFSFIINMKTARKLEFYPPINMLKFAEVITE